MILGNKSNHSLLKRYLPRALDALQTITMEEERVQEQKEANFGKFNIFLLTKTAQNSYGLKNGDYARYRVYCAHKIRKLRLSMNIKYGTKTKFIRKDVLKEKTHDPKVLQFLLFQAEKNWALANQTKFSTMRKPSQKSRGRFYSIKKLAKALQWAQRLHSICRERTDNVSQLQAQAYELFLDGTLQFEKQRWSEAQSKLIACRQIMPDLAKVSDSLSEKIFKERVDQIEQSIKFCNFKISKGRELSIAQIVQLRKGGDTSLSNLMDSLAEKWMSNIKLAEDHGEVRFGSQRYPIKEPEIAKQKAKIEASQANLDSFKTKWLGQKEDQKLFDQLMSLYSQLVLQIEEAIRLCDSQREDSKKKQKYTQGELEILKKVSLLFTQTKMNVFVDRNLIVFRSSYQTNRGRKSTPQTLAKLLTNTITLLQELAEVAKQKGQISNTFDVEEVQAIDAKSFYLRTLRLLFVGQVYFNNQKIREAYGLWSECGRCIRILLSKEEMNQNKSDGFIGCLISLQSLLESVRKNQCQCIIANFQNEEGTRDDLNKKMGDVEIEEKKIEEQVNSVTLQTLISENRDHCPLSLEEIAKVPVIDLPGRLQPMPTRPIFFDIFYLNLTYPSVQAKMKKVETGKTSWWGRLFK